MRPVYLDYNATTPLDPAVLDAMLPFLREEFGNPSSAHPLGQRAHAAIEAARAQVAALIGAAPDEITFTSGGTEASNIAIRGAVARDAGRREIVTTVLEHPATEACCALLRESGCRVTSVACDRDGVIDARAVSDAINERTAIVTIIHAQNEIGTLQPIATIAKAARAHGALMHADAAQSLGKVPVAVDELGVDCLSIAGHKLYAPKGVGALYVRAGVTLPPLLRGAGQEHGRRAGTENVAGIVALGESCRIAKDYLEQGTDELAELTTTLLARLKYRVPGLVAVGEHAPRLPNTLNVLFPEASGRRLLEACPAVLASTGSACHAGSEAPSAIQLALGIAPDRALGAVRLSLGRHTTRDEIETAADALAAAWTMVREPARRSA